MNSQIHIEPFTPDTKDNYHLRDYTPQLQEGHMDAPSQKTCPDADQQKPCNTLAPVQNKQYILMYPQVSQGYSFQRTNPAIILTEATPRLGSPQQSTSQQEHEQFTPLQLYDAAFNHHTPDTHAQVSANQDPEIDYPEIFPSYAYNHHITFPSPYEAHPSPDFSPDFRAIPRSNEDYQAIVHAMAIGDFNIPIFGTAGEGFQHNASRAGSTTPGTGSVVNGGVTQQNLIWQTPVTPAPQRRKLKRGGDLLSMLLK